MTKKTTIKNIIENWITKNEVMIGKANKQTEIKFVNDLNKEIKDFIKENYISHEDSKSIGEMITILTDKMEETNFSKEFGDILDSFKQCGVFGIKEEIDNFEIR